MKPQDFRVISKERHIEISSKGGEACHKNGKAFSFTKKTASEAGKKGAEKRAKIVSWMKENKSSYEDALDLAADCCSVFKIWREDFSVPKYVMRKAIELFKESNDKYSVS